MKLTNEELDAILANAGLELAQPYAENGKYRKDEYLFTRCPSCERRRIIASSTSSTRTTLGRRSAALAIGCTGTATTGLLKTPPLSACSTMEPI
ncbi:hypothetical protein [Senegalimassilia anaerobia]|uniref:hypothetical protein n=1 Tax=Senegalimassilia anaerobia TaxID=1473216 RepID=UPI003A985395